MEPTTARAFSAGDLILSCDPWIWAFKWKEYGRTCAYCCNERSGLLKCSACKVHRYCSPVCQVADWKKGHKEECAVMKSIGAHFAEKSCESGCEAFRCCCTGLIMWAKLDRKLKDDNMDDIPGLGKKSICDILHHLPSRDASKSVTTMTHHGLFGIIEYNVFPILRSGKKTKALGAGLFLQAPYRSMTPACWDTNVTMDFRSRTLFLHANNDIARYTGVHDLRYNEFMTNEYLLPLTERRIGFYMFYGQSCTCRKCTSEYEAEINPLKCSTATCTERIPSDERGLDPCPQCGAVNADRLKKYRYFAEKFDNLWNTTERDGDNVKWNAGRNALCIEMETAAILHSDAHLRLACGWDLAVHNMKVDKYDEGWKMLQEFVGCVRKIFPKYNCDRAMTLTCAGKAVILALKKLVLRQSGITSFFEKTRVLCMMNDAAPVALEWYREARIIYATLLGEDSIFVKQTDRLMSDVENHLKGINNQAAA